MFLVPFSSFIFLILNNSVNLLGWNIHENKNRTQVCSIGWSLDVRLIFYECWRIRRPSAGVLVFYPPSIWEKAWREKMTIPKESKRRNESYNPEQSLFCHREWNYVEWHTLVFSFWWNCFAWYTWLLLQRAARLERHFKCLIQIEQDPPHGFRDINWDDLETLA